MEIIGKIYLKKDHSRDYSTFSFKLELPLESLKINEEKTKINRFSLMSTGGRYLMISVINRETKMSWISQIKRALLNLDVSTFLFIISRIIL